MNPTARQCLREGFTGASELRAQSILSDLISAFGKAKASLVQGQIEHHLEDIVSRLSRIARPTRAPIRTREIPVSVRRLSSR